MDLVMSHPASCYWGSQKWSYIECFSVIFCCQNFTAGRHTKVAIHSLSFSLSQLPCLKVQIAEQWSSHAQGGCIARIAMHVLANWNWATIQENLHHVFYKFPYFSVSILSYTCIFAFALVEYETMCSQSCVSCWSLSVLPMWGHDGEDVTYSCSSFTSYNCSSCFWSGHADR
jgi:hypothetical protein